MRKKLIAIGTKALDGSTSAHWNIAIGNDAMGNSGLSGDENVGVGHNTLLLNTTGSLNVGVGQNTLAANTTGYRNVAVGNHTLDNNTTGYQNVGIGSEALANASTGFLNVSIGYNSGYNNNGTRNTFIGALAGQTNTGSDNVFIGAEAGANETGSGKLYIDNSNTILPLIYGDFSTNEVGINHNNPNSTLDIGGSVGMIFKNAKVAGTDHPDASGVVWRYTSGTGDITLPSASMATYRLYIIVNHTGATRNISSYTNILNVVVTTIANLNSLTLMSDGVGWFQVR